MRMWHGIAGGLLVVALMVTGVVLAERNRAIANAEALQMQAENDPGQYAWNVAKDDSRPPADYERALVSAQRYSEENPGAVCVNGTIAVLQHRLGRQDEARAALDRLRTLVRRADRAEDEQLCDWLDDLERLIAASPEPASEARN